MEYNTERPHWHWVTGRPHRRLSLPKQPGHGDMETLRVSHPHTLFGDYDGQTSNKALRSQSAWSKSSVQ